MDIFLLPAGILAVWLLVCAWYYFQQERVIFQPSRLAANHQFEFERPFEEHRIEVEPGVELSALLFPAANDASPPGDSSAAPAASARSSRPVVMYLHGNASDLQGWGWHADLYVEAGHDFFVLDYRGYGKSDGEIESEEQAHADVWRAWEWLTERYAPENVTVVGYSLGSALAARLACDAAGRGAPRPDAPGASASGRGGPGRLVLLAPFYSVRDLAKRTVPFVPIFLLRYPFRTDQVLADCDLPVTIFHGVNDRTVPVEQAERLAALLGDRARLVRLPTAGHQDIPDDPVFRREMRALLASETAP